MGKNSIENNSQNVSRLNTVENVLPETKIDKSNLIHNLRLWLMPRTD